MRFLYDNPIFLATTALLASSQQPTAPVSFLQSRIRTKTWRSKIGWNVVAGWNDRLPFYELGTPRYGLLTPGNYATGAEFAAEIARAMNDPTPGGVFNIYTVTYDVETGKFSIADGGVAYAFQLRWLSEPEASVGPDLGFDVSADLTSALTYEAEQPSFQGREWISIAFPAPVGYSAAFVLNHNVSTTGEVRFQANDSDVWTAPAVDVELLSDPASAIRGQFFTAPAAHRYMRLLIDDVQNNAGFSELGLLYACTYLDPEYSWAVDGPGETPVDYSSQGVSDQGALFQMKRGRAESRSGSLPPVSKADRDALRVMEAAIGKGGHALVAFAPDDFPLTETFYGALSVDSYGPVQETLPALRYPAQISFLEDLG